MKHAKGMLGMAMIMAIFVGPMQLLLDDMHGLNTLEHQPAKVATIEVVLETRRGAPLFLFAWPDEKTEGNLFSVEISKLSSLILTYTAIFYGVFRGKASHENTY